MSDLEAKSTKMQADMDGITVDYEKKGYTVEYIGEADVEGTACYQLRVDTNQDIIQDLFFDKDHFLAIKLTSTVMVDEREIVQDTYMSDFQEIDGRIVPFSIETRMGEMTQHQVVMESMEYDVDVSGVDFAMPAATEAVKE